jgi:tetratricopeptide (TPR) repeat protein
MSIYQIWVPGEIGYKEHLDRLTFSNDLITVVKEQTNQFKNIINRQFNLQTDRTKNLIASNEQIISALDNSLDRLLQITEHGFNQLAQINTRGFNQVTSAVELLHSDMNFYFGVVIQKLEYQNSLLNNILSTLQKPFESKVKEYYEKGCLFIKQGFLEGAIDCFKESISLKMGEYFFPSYFQLGRIYLTGIDEGINMVDLNSATAFLLKANEFGNRIVKTDKSFNPILADCKYFLSQSYYFKLTGKATASELETINKAIQFCEEAVVFNNNLSQSHYYLAKYYSYRISKFKNYQNNEELEKILSHFSLAVQVDRNYLRSVIIDDPLYDSIFAPIHKYLIERISNLTNKKRIDAQNLLDKKGCIIKQLDDMNTSKSQVLAAEYLEAKKQYQIALKDFQSKTYFGFDDCQIKLEAI